MGRRVDRWALVAWIATTLIVALAVSGGKIQPMFPIELAVLSMMLVFLTLCQAFPAGPRSVANRLLFLLGSAVGQIALAVLACWFAVPLMFFSPFGAMAGACIVAALPFVVHEMRRSDLFGAPQATGRGRARA